MQSPSHDNLLDAGHVFVYGTLRRGDDNDITQLSPPPQYVCDASIRGTMYHLGAYPGVVLGGTGIVQGEVYSIDAQLQKKLDEIEEVYPQQRDEYFKRLLTVQTPLGNLACICYEINPAYITGRRIIGSGDWVKDR